RRHEKGVAHGKNGRAIDHDAIVELRGFGHEFSKGMAAQELRWVRCTAAAGENGELSAGRRHRAGSRGRAGPDYIHVARRDDTHRISQRDITDEVIDDSILFVVLGFLAALGSDVAENLVQAGAAQVAVDQQDTVALLGEREGVVRTREALALVRQSAGEQENLSLFLRTEER